MDILSLSLFCITGLVLLVAGGEILTAASSKLAALLGMKPIIIGLTIVAFGTSMPEAFVSIFASLKQNPDIAIANVVGSNIFNLTFILGVAAVIRPLKVEVSSIKREVPFVIGSACLLWVLAYDRILSRLDGALILILFVFFLWTCFRNVDSSETEPQVAERSHEKKSVKLVQLFFSLILLVLGARFLVEGATGLARLMGLSDLLIGLTIVAAGTSLPELATSVMASVRAKDDLAVGNVTGSNIFNILFILGASSLLFPLAISDKMFSRDIPLMVLISLLALPILKSGFVISRQEGVVLILAYMGYVVMLVQAG